MFPALCKTLNTLLITQHPVSSALCDLTARVQQPEAFTAMTSISVSPRAEGLRVVAPSRDEPVPPDALKTAERLAAGFARTAAERDQQGGTPKAERDQLRDSGLLALSIPAAYGGLGASW
ncbi:acyl-CoA dehydrogenase family protein, partial [Burkholderia contaminans]|uniref:acyl-CoA dehydrogenase family protein n=1 Tax=Burkholderia contaminans TaxID=488447 RepID=UPI002D7FC08B